MSRKDTVRFAVGTPNTRRSRTWYLWSQQSDVYLAARDTRGIVKASFHAADGAREPICHLALLNDELRKEVRGSPIATRFLQQWPRIPAPYDGISVATQLTFFPQSLSTTAVETKPVTWIPAPTENQFVEVVMLFRSPQSTERFHQRDSSRVLFDAQLPNGDHFRAFYSIVEAPGSADEIRRDLRERRNKMPDEMRELTDNAKYAGLLFNLMPDGHHRIIDVDAREFLKTR